MTFRSELERACADNITIDLVVNDTDLDMCYKCKVLVVGDDYVKIQVLGEDGDEGGVGILRLERVVEMWLDPTDRTRELLNRLMK